MAIDLYNYLDDNRAFKTGDRSKEERLNTIANQVKHMAGCVRRGVVEEFHSVPIWLTNKGISSFCKASVTYDEATEVLRDISRVAEDLNDPYGFRGERAGAARNPASITGNQQA